MNKNILLTIMNEDFERIVIIEEYSSLIWTERYNDYGDFELEIPYSIFDSENMKLDYYIKKSDSDSIMIIDTIEESYQFDNSDTVIFRGKSLDSILDRRVVLDTDYISGTVSSVINQLINQSITNPSNYGRQILNFKHDTSNDDKLYNNQVINITPKGISLYSVVASICKTYDLGFKTVLDDDNNFIFSLYNSVDRSHDQTLNSFVVFSKVYDNLFNTTKYKTNSSLATVAVVSDSAEGSKKLTLPIPSNYGEGVGLKRREVAVDSSATGKDEDTTQEEYERSLYEEGLYSLNVNEVEEYTVGEVDTEVNFVYGRDYFAGDKVQIIGDDGTSTKASVSEVISSVDSAGYRITPTMVSLGTNTEQKKVYDDWVYELGTPLSYISFDTEDVVSGVLPYLFDCGTVKLSDITYELTWKDNSWGRYFPLTDYNDAYNYWVYVYPQSLRMYSTYRPTPTSTHEAIGTVDNFWSLNKRTLFWDGTYYRINNKPTLNASVLKNKTIDRLAVLRLYGATSSLFSNISFYGFKLFEKGIKKADVIPFQTKEGEVGILNLVDKQFSKGYGINKFTAGHPIDDKIEILPYMEINTMNLSNTICSLETDVLPNANVEALQRTGVIKYNYDFTPMAGTTWIIANYISDVSTSGTRIYNSALRPYLILNSSKYNVLYTQPVLHHHRNNYTMEFEYGQTDVVHTLNNTVFTQTSVSTGSFTVQTGPTVIGATYKTTSAGFDLTRYPIPTRTKFHNFKIYIDEEVVCDIYPVLINETKKAFYDIITHRVVSYLGVDESLKSSKEIEAIKPVYLEHVQFNDVYIKTGVMNDSEDMDFLFDGVLANVTNGQMPFGSVHVLPTQYSPTIYISSNIIRTYIGSTTNTNQITPPNKDITINLSLKQKVVQTTVKSNITDWSETKTVTMASDSLYAYDLPNIMGVQAIVPDSPENLTYGENFEFNYKYTGTCRQYQVKKNGAIVLDLRPCTFDGEVGMWDEVTNQFFPPEGDGTLIAGPVKEV